MVRPDCGTRGSYLLQADNIYMAAGVLSNEGDLKAYFRDYLLTPILSRAVKGDSRSKDPSTDSRYTGHNQSSSPVLFCGHLQPSLLHFCQRKLFDGCGMQQCRVQG